MASHRRSKIWLSIGTAAVIGAHAPSQASDDSAKHPGNTSAAAGKTLLAQATHQTHPAPPAPEKKPVDTGESGERSGEGLDPRVKFLRDLGLIRGHLLVGDELVKAGKWDEALPHFHHPVEELYAVIAPTLKKHKMRDFDAALKALAQTVQSKSTGAYAAALKVVDERMAAVDKATIKFTSPKERFALRAAIAMMQSAVAEYKEAIEDGRIAKPVEYQDARGFVWHAEKVIRQAAPDLQRTNKASYEATLAALADLKVAWPAVEPPAAPVKTDSEVAALVSKVELAAHDLLNP